MSLNNEQKKQFFLNICSQGKLTERHFDVYIWNSDLEYLNMSRRST